jgi:hypothetical protein
MIQAFIGVLYMEINISVRKKQAFIGSRFHTYVATDGGL